MVKKIDKFLVVIVLLGSFLSGFILLSVGLDHNPQGEFMDLETGNLVFKTTSILFFSGFVFGGMLFLLFAFIFKLLGFIFE